MKTILPFLAACLLMPAAQAADPDVAARERYMKDFRAANKTIASELKRSKPDMDALAKQTAALQAIADKPWPHYTPQSAANSPDAQPAIWQEPQAFRAASTRFIEAVSKLNTAAQSRADPGELKTAFSQLGQSCKACHSDFRR